MHNAVPHNGSMRGGDLQAAKRLVLARERKGYLTATAAAEALGVPVQTYLAHENGGNGFRRSAATYARFFGVNYEWLSIGRGPMTGSSRSEVQDIFDELPTDKKPLAISLLKTLKNTP
jgi:DNA-binding XRE family transcriptional regulator